MFNIQDIMDKYPEFGKKEYPEYCSVCGVSLTNEDGVMIEIRNIKSKYENKKRKTGLKRKKAVIVEITKMNEQSALGNKQIKHNLCEGGSQYCAYDGSKLKNYGFQGGGEKRYDTNLVCGLCGHTDSRIMTSKDRKMFLANSPVIAQMLL
jgi:hypothetical protein